MTQLAETANLCDIGGMNEDETKAKIKVLVDKYESAKSTTGLRNYSEEDTIKDFVLPLFNILG